MDSSSCFISENESPDPKGHNYFIIKTSPDVPLVKSNSELSTQKEFILKPLNNSSKLDPPQITPKDISIEIASPKPSFLQKQFKKYP